MGDSFYCIRPRPYVSGYFRVRILFFPDTPSVHTHPVNPTCESGNFWIRSPEWKLLNPLSWVETFESALLSGNFWIRYFFGYVWTVESGYFRIRWRWRCKIESSLYSRLDRVATKQHGSQPKRSCCSCRAESSWQDSQSVLSFVFEVLYSIHAFVGVRPRHRSK